MGSVDNIQSQYIISMSNDCYIAVIDKITITNIATIDKISLADYYNISQMPQIICI